MTYQESPRQSDVDKLPEGWHPPPKEFCNEDLVTTFSMMLVDETVGMLLAEAVRREGRVVIEKYALFNSDGSNSVSIDTVSQIWNNSLSRLKNVGCNQYEDSSIFMHYKIMRDRWLYQVRQENPDYIFRSNFTPNSKLEDIVEKAREVVVGWWEI